MVLGSSGGCFIWELSLKFHPYVIGTIIAFILIAGLEVAQNRFSIGRPNPSTQPSESSMVTVRLLTPEGTLSGPVEVSKIVKADAEWKKLLTPEQFRIVRSAGTERPFCGGFLNNKEPGMYLCVACNLPLFDSDAKFESGTGWPSFFRPAVAENVATKSDTSHGMVRNEINCARCDGHLGHVFDDGPRPTGLRYCLNSESLKFAKTQDLKTFAEPLPTTQPAK